MASKAVVKEIGRYEVRKASSTYAYLGSHCVRESGASSRSDIYCESLEAAEKMARSLAGTNDDGEGSATTAQLIAGESY
jgi:hypothetical protein